MKKARNIVFVFLCISWLVVFCSLAFTSVFEDMSKSHICGLAVMLSVSHYTIRDNLD